MSQCCYQNPCSTNNNNSPSCNCNCQCHCHYPECSAIKPNNYSENSPILNNTNTPNQLSSTFYQHQPYSYNNSPKIINSKTASNFYKPKTLNNNPKFTNTLFRSRTNLTNNINYNTTKTNNNKCYNTVLPESDSIISSLGRKYLKNGKTVYFNSMDKIYKFNRNNSGSSKNKKLYYLNNENDRLKQLLKKVPKHDKNYIYGSVSSSVFDNFINSSKKANKNIMNSKKSYYRNNFHSFSVDKSRQKRSEYKKYNSFVMPANILNNTNKTLNTINF